LLEEKINDRSAVTSVAQKELDLLSRHLDILNNVKNYGPIGIIRLSQITGQPQHVIRYSLRTLEKDGMIISSPYGAIVTDKIYETLGTLESSLNNFTNTVLDLKKKLK
jgi:predicted transcriptional regulator